LFRNSISMKSISTYDFKGKRALIRVDFNVPLDKTTLQVTDDTRIKAAIPTIKKVLEGGGSVVLMSHLGRPKNIPEDKYSMKNCIPVIEKHLGFKIQFATDCIGDRAFEQSASLKPGEVLLLENLRFHQREEKGDVDLAGAGVHDLFVGQERDAAEEAVEGLEPGVEGGGRVGVARDEHGLEGLVAEAADEARIGDDDAGALAGVHRVGRGGEGEGDLVGGHAVEGAGDGALDLGDEGRGGFGVGLCRARAGTMPLLGRRALHIFVDEGLRGPRFALGFGAGVRSGWRCGPCPPAFRRAGGSVEWTGGVLGPRRCPSPSRSNFCQDRVAFGVHGARARRPPFDHLVVCRAPHCPAGKIAPLPSLAPTK
jgi:hypothetical protein